jgi:hypothetical protein
VSLVKVGNVRLKNVCEKEKITACQSDEIRSQDKTMYQADENSRKTLSNNTYFLCMWE